MYPPHSITITTSSSVRVLRFHSKEKSRVIKLGQFQVSVDISITFFPQPALVDELPPKLADHELAAAAALARVGRDELLEELDEVDEHDPVGPALPLHNVGGLIDVPGAELGLLLSGPSDGFLDVPVAVAEVLGHLLRVSAARSWQ